MARETVNGHYKGSNKQKVRDAFDSGGAKKAMKKAEGLGLSLGTARNYISEFTTGNAPKSRAAASKSASKKSPAKKAVKTAKKAVKAPAAKKVKVANLHG